MKIIADNKKARFDYFIEDSLEAGLVLTGSEIKSLRGGGVAFKDSYISFRNSEAFWQNGHIAPYKSSSYNNHEPERLRKLLLHRTELHRLEKAIQEKGLTIVPLKIYLKEGLAKLEIGIARGRKHADKRELLKGRDAKRDLQRQMRKSR